MEFDTSLPSATIATPQQRDLKIVRSPSGFVFPALFSFPPFFTRQPNPTTWAKQLAVWHQLILSYTRSHKIFRLELTQGTCDGELFNNRNIRRKVDLALLREIVDDMVRSGMADYDPPLQRKADSPSGALVYWKTPEEWGNVIYSWIVENGLTGSIMTFYELTQGGDLAHTTEFYNLPHPLLMRSLQALSKQGKAQVFRGTSAAGPGVGDEGDGVKFL